MMNFSLQATGHKKKNLDSFSRAIAEAQRIDQRMTAATLSEYNFGISVAQAGWGVENVRMDVQVVPIPAAAWLFGSALGIFGLMGRRKANA